MIGHRPIPDGTEVFKPNRYTAYQSPLLPEEPSGFFNQYFETLPSSAQDFSDVTLAYEESSFEYFGVTLARENARLGELLLDPDRRCEFHFYRLILTIENIFIETCYC